MIKSSTGPSRGLTPAGAPCCPGPRTRSSGASSRLGDASKPLQRDHVADVSATRHLQDQPRAHGATHDVHVAEVLVVDEALEGVGQRGDGHRAVERCVRPKPGRSTAPISRSAAGACRTGSQLRWLEPRPWTSNSGVPEPRRPGCRVGLPSRGPGSATTDLGGRAMRQPARPGFVSSGQSEGTKTSGDATIEGVGAGLAR